MVGLWAHGWWCTDWEKKAWQITYWPLRLPPRNDTHLYAHTPLARASHVSTPTFREAGKPNPSMFPGWQPKSASGHSTCVLPPQAFEHTHSSAWNTFSSIFWSNSCLSFSSKFKLWKTFPDWVKYYAPPTHPIESRCLLPISQRHGMPHGQGNMPTTTSIILSTGIQVLRMQTQFPQLPEKKEGVQVFLVPLYPLGICSRIPADIKSTVAQIPYVQWHSICI